MALQLAGLRGKGTLSTSQGSRFPSSEHSCIPEGRAALFTPTKGLADNRSAHWQSTTGLEPFDAPHTPQLGKPPSSKASEETL